MVNETQNKKSRELEALMERFAVELSEHFEAVQILCSRSEEGLTFCAKRGNGNWYARIGMAQEFIEEDQAKTFAREMPQEKPDGDDWKQPIEP